MATSDYVDVGGRKNDLSLIERPSSRTPGGIEMWIFILGDMTVFAGFFIAYLWSFRRNRGEFVTDSSDLVLPIGALNTLILLISSYLIIQALQQQRNDRPEAARKYLMVTLICAGCFTVSKILEYGLGLSAGHGLTSSQFLCTTMCSRGCIFCMSQSARC